MPNGELRSALVCSHEDTSQSSSLVMKALSPQSFTDAVMSLPQLRCRCWVSVEEESTFLCKFFIKCVFLNSLQYEGFLLFLR